MDQPILRNAELEKLRQVSHEIFDAATLDITWPIEDGPDGMEIRLDGALCEEAESQVDHGANILILSDRNLGPERVAMPSLLAVAAVHHHLVRAGTRLRTGLVIESGEPRDIHHMATLIGYGAVGDQPVPDVRVARRARRPLAAARGPRARRGRAADRQGDRQGAAQDDLQDGDLDDPVLLRGADLRGRRARAERDRPPLHRHGVADRRHRARRARRPRRWSATSAPIRGPTASVLPVGGVLQWRRDGERHIWNPDTIAKLQHAVRAAARARAPTAPERQRRRQRQRRRRPRSAGDLRRVRPQANDEATRASGAARADEASSTPTSRSPLDEVEPATEIVKRFTHRRDVASARSPARPTRRSRSR